MALLLAGSGHTMIDEGCRTRLGAGWEKMGVREESILFGVDAKCTFPSVTLDANAELPKETDMHVAEEMC